MDGLIQDLRHGLRQLRRSPGFAAAAVLILALGIGAAVAIFSVLDALLIRSLPYEDADRIVTIWEENTRVGVERDDVAPGNFLDWSEQARSFEAIAAVDPWSLDLTGGERPEVVLSARATEGFFRALGTRALHGRTFLPEDFREGGGRVVVLSHSLWERRFGADPELVGRAIELDGEPYTLIGVLPPGFDPQLHPSVRPREAWVPLILRGWERTERGSRWWNAVAKLRPDVSLADARAELELISARLAREHPETNTGIRPVLVPLREHLVGSARGPLLVLQGAVGLLLLIACANLAGLLLARGAQRGEELAVRVALGAGRARLIRQMLAETGAITVLGGALGVCLGAWALSLIGSLAPADLPRLEDVSVNGRVLLFSGGLIVLTATVAGLLPALQLSRSGLQASIKAGRSGPAAAGAQRLRSGMVVAEIALSMVLVVGAGLLARSFVELLRVDPGFDRENVAVVQVFRYADEETLEERRAFFRRAVEDIEALPGVRSAAAVSALPFIEANIGIQQQFVRDEGSAVRRGEVPSTYVTAATAGYFRAMGIPVLEGRGIEPTDHADAPRVAVVSEALKRRHWPGESPVGRRIRFLDDGGPLGTDSTAWVEIVGVVGQLRHEGLDHEPRPELFLPHSQTGMGSMTFVARAEDRARPLLERMEERIWAQDPLQAIYRSATLDELLSKSVAPRRFQLWILGTFASLALILATVGLFGLVSYSTRTRAREFGVRMALGADAGRIVREAMGRGLRLGALGVGVGLLGALGLTRTLRALLFGVSPLDPVTYLAVTVLLLGVALAATWLPARRAARTDPLVALRAER